MPNEPVMARIRARVDAHAPMRTAEQHSAEPAEPGSEGSEDVLMVLTRDHNQVHTLIQQLSAPPGHKSGGSPEDLSRRKSIVDMITARMSQHEAAEEELFWPAVRKALPGGDTWADLALAQEAKNKATLTALTGLEPDRDEFGSLVQRLAAQVRKHVAYEAQVFGLMREAMPEGDREKLGEQLLAARKAAGKKTRAARSEQTASKHPA